MNSSNLSSTISKKSNSSKKNIDYVWYFILILLITVIFFLLFIFIGKCRRKKRRRIQRREVVIKRDRQSRSNAIEPRSGRAIDHVGCLTDMIVADQKLKPIITDGSSTTYRLSTNSITHNSFSEKYAIEDLLDLDLVNVPLRRLKLVNEDTTDALSSFTSQNSSEHTHISSFKTTTAKKKTPFNVQVSIDSKTNDESRC